MRRFLVPLILVAVTAGIVVALVGSETSGTGAENVGSREPAATATATARRSRAAATPEPPRRCEATQSNPGGDNNYIEQAPRVESLGSGFVIAGQVRAADGCEPLRRVPVQIWLATETGSETDNRAEVLTDADGRYSLDTAKTISQFGEPNIHVAYDGAEYEQVFIRRVVDLDDTRATVDLTLRAAG